MDGTDVRQDDGGEAEQGLVQNKLYPQLGPGVETKPKQMDSLQIAEDGDEDGDGPAPPEVARANWSTRFDFLLSTIGFAVDLANVWRFPYLCYRNGGGAFLIPYFCMLVFGALPLFFMELVLGQYHQEGVISLWKIAPIFKGIGWCACLISFYVAFYYNVVIAWAMHYFFASFTLGELPWTSCHNSWNTPNCWDPKDIHNLTGLNKTDAQFNYTQQHLHVNASFGTSPAAEYFERNVLSLHLSEGMHDLGQPKLYLLGCTALVFFILYFSLWKGVKSMGPAVWFTATMPYMVLTVLLIRGVMLPGAGDGIKYFITPKFDRLLVLSTWIDAAVQIFYSVGAGFGVHIAYSSYNPKTNNCYRDCIFACVVNSFTSLFSGFVIFSYLGFMALEKGVPISEVASEGPGLVFIVYPEAMSTLPGSAVWSVIFFIMLLTLGLDSSFGGLEAILSGLKDEFRSFFDKYRFSRELCTLAVIIAAFLFSIMNVTYGGMYMVTLMDTYSAGTSILFVALTQAVAVSWVYGMDQFCSDIRSMLGFTPGIYWRVCWKIISPIFLLTIVISSLVSYNSLIYAKGAGIYVYPGWAMGVGWGITASSIVLIPIMAIFIFMTTKGKDLRQKLALVISPVWEHRAIRRGAPIKRFQVGHWLKI